MEPQFRMPGNYFGDNYRFELIGKIPVSVHADACFQLATDTGTGAEFLFVQEQAGQLARPYRKQGLIIPPQSIPYYKKKEEECIKQFYAMAKMSYENLDDLK